mmetsp:Transcript_33063/g.55355  ORF Transcript_33063/g.55355 Transcript_33063/m.55355 type:complete len:280 (-) Transcript_33063:553-1392(-)
MAMDAATRFCAVRPLRPPGARASLRREGYSSRKRATVGANALGFSSSFLIWSRNANCSTLMSVSTGTTAEGPPTLAARFSSCSRLALLGGGSTVSMKAIASSALFEVGWASTNGSSVRAHSPTPAAADPAAACPHAHTKMWRRSAPWNLRFVRMVVACGSRASGCARSTRARTMSSPTGTGLSTVGWLDFLPPLMGPPAVSITTCSTSSTNLDATAAGRWDSHCCTFLAVAWGSSLRGNSTDLARGSSRRILLKGSSTALNVFSKKFAHIDSCTSGLFG